MDNLILVEGVVEQEGDFEWWSVADALKAQGGKLLNAGSLAGGAYLLALLTPKKG